MPGYGYVVGTANRGATSRAGEKVLWTYNGALSDGQALRTYLSGFDTYQVGPATDMRDNTGYSMGVYEVYTSYEKYGMVYISIYGAHAGTPANAIPASVLIIGDR